MRLPAYRVYLVYSAAFAFFTGMIFTYSSVYQITVAGLNPLQLVLVGTMLELSVFVFEVPTGIVADVYSRRLSIIIGVFLIGIGFIVEGAVPLFFVILLGQFLWGVGWTFTSGATNAWITDEIGELAAGEAFLRSSQAGSVGGMLGILLGVALAAIRVNVPILVGGGLFIALGVFLIFTMPETGFRPTPDTERNTWQQMGHTFRTGLGMVQRRPILMTILAIGLVYGLYSEGYDRLWTKLILDNFLLPSLGPLDPTAWFGIIRWVSMLLSLAATEVVRRKVDTTGDRGLAKAQLILAGLLIASLIVFSLSGSFALALAAFWAIAVLRTVIDPLYTTWVNQRIDSNVRATVLSMSSQVDAIGQVAGGPAVGWIGSAVSVRAAILTSSLVLSPVLLLYGRAIRSSDRLREKNEPGGASEAPLDPS